MPSVLKKNLILHGEHSYLEFIVSIMYATRDGLRRLLVVRDNTEVELCGRWLCTELSFVKSNKISNSCIRHSDSV